MATQDGESATTTARASLAFRGVSAYFALSLAIAGLYVAWLFGAKVLAGAGWVGAPGRLAVERCVDQESTSSDGAVVRTSWCSGAFRPDDGGPEIEHVMLKGGRGDAYLPPRRGSRCYGNAPDRPWWCKGDQPTSVAVRYLDGEAWTFGSGLLVPGPVSLLGLCGFGVGLLLTLQQTVWPDPERRPRWLRRRIYDICVVGTLSWVVLLAALAFDVNG
ncbi:hypothetical protein AB0M39_30465 [Streptomyces sp. NPDC051907]|uniref:hypothetical protein n=1 Tax=Streptomyces sp. NPDC051907 TaxID=3155284 RepID=UPI00344143AE